MRKHKAHLARKHLEALRSVKRKEYHPLQHHIHKKYGISKKTLLYVKEYGPHSNVPRTIIRESVRILLFASVISSLGGLAVENIKLVFLSIMPLIIIFPVLNDMIGDYGIIISSRFSTLLHTGKVRGKWYRDSNMKKLFLQILIIASVTTIVSISAAMVISFLSGFSLTGGLVLRVFLIGITDVLLLVSVLFIVAMVAGIHYFRKNEDPGNFLIPITTSIADFGNMMILALLVVLFF